jgi:hypothetical protein
MAKTIVSVSEELKSLMAFLPPVAGNQIWRVANKTGRTQTAVESRVFRTDDTSLKPSSLNIAVRGWGCLYSPHHFFLDFITEHFGVKVD